VTPGGGTRLATVVISADRARRGLTVVVPLTGKPADVTLGTPSLDTTGRCTSTAREIRCTGVSIAATDDASLTVPVTVATGATGGVWTVRGVTVTDGAHTRVVGAGRLVTVGPKTYRLSATVTGSAADAVPPGGTAAITSTITNSGPVDAVNAPITVHAPTGATFGTPLPAGCTASTARLLTCTATVAAGDTHPRWSIPITAAAGADPSQALTGGCLDLIGDGTCDGASDIALPDIPPRSTLAAVVSDIAVAHRIAPSGTTTTTPETATATIGITASAGASTELEPDDLYMYPYVPNDNSDILPRTGANVLGLVALGVLLVVAGMTVRVAARKTRPLRGCPTTR
jgi:hypothetical protein